MFDLVIRGATLVSGETAEIGVAGGVIGAIGRGLVCERVVEAGGRLVSGGLVETHVHLDKSRIMGRCACGSAFGGGLAGAVRAVAAAKRGFTEADVCARARETLERAIGHGVMAMRTHVEVDPRIGLVGVRALLRLKREYAWAIDLELCCFPQEGLIDDPGCEAVLVAALEAGCDLVGGAPYMDRDAHGQIGRIFAIARRFDVGIDFHLDNTLDGDGLDALEVCRMTEAAGWGGRVAIGHATKLSTLAPADLEAVGRRLAAAGVSVAVLPATDLFIMGAGLTENVPRGVAPAHRLRAAGVTCSLSTNNVLNPFTPFGDGSLLRIANLFANVAQVGDTEGLAECFEMISTEAGRALGRDCAVVVGGAADLVMWDCGSPAQAVAEIAPAVMGWKRGRLAFERAGVRLMPP